MVFRLFWLALHHAPYGCDEQAFRRVWPVVPCFGLSASLSGSHTSPEYDAFHKFLNVFQKIKKEQLCSNASSTHGWKRNPPPYIDHFDVWVEYSNKVVAMPSLFPPLTPFGKATPIDCSRGNLQVEEDVLLRVHAMLPSDADIVPFLKITEWKILFPSFPSMPACWAG